MRLQITEAVKTLFGLRATKVSGSHPRDPGLVKFFDIASTESGVDVTEEKAMTYSAVYACVRNIAEDIAKLPLNLFQRVDKGGKERLINHPLFGLIHDAPNPDMSSYNFREAMTGWVASRGNGYAEIERDGAGRPIGLHILPSTRVAPKRMDDGTLFYEVQEVDGGMTNLSQMNVLHIRNLSGDGIMGWSIIRTAAESIGQGIATRDYTSRFFGNNSTPGGVLEHPAQLSPEASIRLKKSWEEKHQRANQHRVAILEEGLKWQSIGISAEDAQLIESAQFQVRDIARFYRMPPHKIQDLANATFTNIEMQSIEYVQDTLQPWLERWEQEADRKLLMPTEQNTLFIEHNVDGLLRGDSKARGEHQSKLFMIGALSINEIRAMENMNPIGSDGDEYFIQGAMVTVESVVNGEAEEDDTGTSPPNPPEPPPDVVDESEESERSSRLRRVILDAHRPLIEGEIRGILTTESDKVKRASRKDGFESWVGNFYDEHRLYVRAKLGDAIEAAAEAAWMVTAEEMPGELRKTLSEWQTANAGLHVEESLQCIDDEQELNSDTRAATQAVSVITKIEEMICQFKPSKDES